MNKRTRSFIALAAIVLLVLAASIAAAAPVRGSYTATITPTETCAGAETTFHLTIACTQIAQQGLGSAVISVPAGFVLSGTPSVTSPAGKPWAVAFDGSSLVLTSDANANRLACGAAGESVTVNFTATAANVGFYTWDTFGYQSTDGQPDDQYVISGLQPTVDVLQCGQTCYESETAWAAGSRYVEQGNWATYTPYVADQTVTLFAGQTMDAGTVHFSAVTGGNVTITIALNAGWSFQDVAENVKIQDYAEAPSGNPSPGQFAWKGDAGSSPFSITVPANNFYGVHLDLMHEVACPAP